MPIALPGQVTRRSSVRAALVALVLAGTAGCSATPAPVPVPAWSAAPASSVAPAPASTSSAASGGSSSVTVTEESYGPHPQQVVTVSRPAAGTGKTVIFLHGGGWRTGDRGSLRQEAAEWARTGWVSINVGYRLGAVDGRLGDGKAILADVEAVLARYRTQPYVDPSKIVVYGESAGGHLATWLGAYRGDQIAATIAISPVTSISGAIAAAEVTGTSSNVRATGGAAREFFGYSPASTSPQAYLDRAKNMFIAFGADDWLDPDIHGRALCTNLGPRCHLVDYPGREHAGQLIEKHPRLVVDARNWADTQV